MNRPVPEGNRDAPVIPAFMRFQRKKQRYFKEISGAGAGRPARRSCARRAGGDRPPAFRRAR
jgi:hypothetical protein